MRKTIDDDDGETLADIARRCRDEAARNGMSEEIYQDLVKDL